MHETSVVRGNISFLASCGGYVMQYWFFRAMLISLLILGLLMMLLSCTSYVMFHVRMTVTELERKQRVVFTVYFKSLV